MILNWTLAAAAGLAAILCSLGTPGRVRWGGKHGRVRDAEEPLRTYSVPVFTQYSHEFVRSLVRYFLMRPSHHVGCAPRRACERRAAAASRQVALAAAKFAGYGF